MKRWIKVLMVFLVVLVVLMLVSGMAIRSLVSGSAKDQLVKSLSDKMGVPISVNSVDFELGSWFLLRPTVALESVAVGNPPGFSNQHLFEAKKIAAVVSLSALLEKSIAVKSIAVDEPQILVETNAKGLTNVGALVSQLSSKGSGGTAIPLAIDELSIKSGTLAVAGSQLVNVKGIDIRLRDFSTDRRCHLEASAILFGGKNSTFKLDAQAGPFSAMSLPLDGTLKVSLELAEMPEGMRREQFGNLIASPGAKAVATVDASVQGDAYGTLAGPAKLGWTNILIGKDASHIMPLSGQADAIVSLQNAVANPSMDLKISEAKLQLGKGQITGSAEVQFQGSSVSGSIRSATHNMDINQLASSLTAANEKIYGDLEVPSFTLQFSGKNAVTIRNSMHGSGKVQVKNGRIGALDMLATLEHAIGQSQQSTAGAKGSTPFENLTADINIAQQKIQVNNLQLTGSAIKASGNGTIDFDQNLHFELTAHVGGTVARLVNTATLHIPSAEAEIPVTVTGTVEAPQVRPSITKMVGSGVKGILNGFFKKQGK